MHNLQAHGFVFILCKIMGVPNKVQQVRVQYWEILQNHNTGSIQVDEALHMSYGQGGPG